VSAEVAQRKEERKKREGTPGQKWKDEEAKKKAAGVAARPERKSKSVGQKSKSQYGRLSRYGGPDC